MSGKYMAYVGSYSYAGRAEGIAMFDADVKSGASRERCEMEVGSSSYVTVSSDGKTLYSIADEEAVPPRILQNGSLARLNSALIRGMRGYHLYTDMEDKYVFVSDYHDGRTMILSLNKDGSVGQIMDGVFNKGYGSVAEHNFRPHVTYTRRMPDGRYVLPMGNGTDQIEVHRFSDKDKRSFQVDAIHYNLESAPRHFRYNSDGRFLYLMYELWDVIYVYSHETGNRTPVVEKVQTISTTSTKNPGNLTAACTMRLSPNEKYVYHANIGENTVSTYNRDEKPGLLTMICCLPVSGEYPKNVVIFPDQKHIVSINHDGGSISFFEVDYERGSIVIYRRSVMVNGPNYCVTAKIGNWSEKIAGLMRQ